MSLECTRDPLSRLSDRDDHLHEFMFSDHKLRCRRKHHHCACT
jgi:hypothetical protein